jgi:hypothetical protein
VADVEELASQLSTLDIMSSLPKSSSIGKAAVPFPTPAVFNTRRSDSERSRKLTYDHEDRTLFPQFLLKLTHRVRHEWASLHDEVASVWLAFECLEGEAAKRIHPWMEVTMDEPTRFTTKSFLEQIKKAFGDPRATATALDKLNKLKQGREDLREFLAIFDQLVLEAGGWGWPEQMKISLLNSALSDDLQDRLSYASEVTTFNDFVAQVHVLDERANAIKRRGQGRKRVPVTTWNALPNLQGSSSKGKARAYDEMDWEATVGAMKSFKRIPTSGKQAKWVSKEDYNARKASGVCYRCGSSSHKVHECPYKPAKKPVKIASVGGKSTTSRPVLEEELTSESDSSGSEN